MQEVENSSNIFLKYELEFIPEVLSPCSSHELLGFSMVNIITHSVCSFFCGDHIVVMIFTPMFPGCSTYILTLDTLEKMTAAAIGVDV